MSRYSRCTASILLVPVDQESCGEQRRDGEADENKPIKVILSNSESVDTSQTIISD